MLGKRAVPPDVDVSMTMVNTSAVVPPSPGGTASRTPSPSLGNLFRPNNWFRRQRTTSSSKATTLQLPELQHGSSNSLSSRMPRISEPKNPRPLPPSASRSVARKHLQYVKSNTCLVLFLNWCSQSQTARATFVRCPRSNGRARTTISRAWCRTLKCQTQTNVHALTHTEPRNLRKPLLFPAQARHCRCLWTRMQSGLVPARSMHLSNRLPPAQSRLLRHACLFIHLPQWVLFPCVLPSRYLLSTPAHQFTNPLSLRSCHLDVTTTITAITITTITIA